MPEHFSASNKEVYMKNVFSASLIKSGLLGGGVKLESNCLHYHTNKIVQKDIIICYDSIASIHRHRFLLFPAVTIKTDKENIGFVIFSMNQFLKSIKALAPDIIIEY